VIAPQAAPLHAGPETFQEMAALGFEPAMGVSVAAYVAVAPVLTEFAPLTTNVKWLVTIIAAVAVLLGSAKLCAVNTTLAGDGSTCGAVYTPASVTEPHIPKQPDTLQLTAGFGFPGPATLAEKGSDPPSSTLAVPGVTLTVMSLEIVTAAEADTEASAWLVALIVTIAGCGRFSGAM
jgi:hypothetical protein